MREPSPTILSRSNVPYEAKYPGERIIRHIRSGYSIPYVVRCYGYQLHEDNVELPHHNWRHSIPDIGVADFVNGNF